MQALGMTFNQLRVSLVIAKIINPLWPSDTIWHQWYPSTLFQVYMTESTKPLHELVLTYCQLCPPKHISMNFDLTIRTSHIRNCIGKCCLRNDWKCFCQISVEHGYWLDCLYFLPTLIINHQSIHRSLVNSPHKGQWRGALMFSMICA